METPDYKKNFIEKASALHKGKYDYSLVDYKNAHKKVKIVCPSHGVFEQNPNNHLSGQGCPMCKRINSRKPKYGVGIFDWHKEIGRGDKEYKSYKKWSAILERCYSESLHHKHPSYIGCSVCEEWRVFTKFKKWFDENYIEGYSLDKDILVKNNKVYSPETCCFVPQSINTLFLKTRANRGEFPIGVCRHSNISYRAQLTIGKKLVCVGIYHTVEEAFAAYKNAREDYIKKVAKDYLKRGKISQKVYEAMINYKVSIFD